MLAPPRQLPVTPTGSPFAPQMITTAVELKMASLVASLACFTNQTIPLGFRPVQPRLPRPTNSKHHQPISQTRVHVCQLINPYLNLSYPPSHAIHSPDPNHPIQALHATHPPPPTHLRYAPLHLHLACIAFSSLPTHTHARTRHLTVFSSQPIKWPFSSVRCVGPSALLLLFRNESGGSLVGACSVHSQGLLAGPESQCSPQLSTCIHLTFLSMLP